VKLQLEKRERHSGGKKNPVASSVVKKKRVPPPPTPLERGGRQNFTEIQKGRGIAREASSISRERGSGASLRRGGKGPGKA